MKYVIKYHKAINNILWSIYIISVLLIASFWILEAVHCNRIAIEVQNGINKIRIHGPHLIDHVIWILEVLIPISFVSLILISLNSYMNKKKNLIFPLTLSFLLTFVVLLGFIQELAKVSIELCGEPLFSRIWWWPLGEILK